MKLLITGGAGFLARRLVLRLLETGAIAVAGGARRAIERITLADVGEPDAALTADPRVAVVRLDLRERTAVEAAVEPDTDLIFHLGAVVSAGAEQDFDQGYAVNLIGMVTLLDACRRVDRPVPLVFTSSIAAYGTSVPQPIRDHTRHVPETSYGAQKAIGELLVSDYTRKGFLDGRTVRLPTIVIRPGAPNRAASGFASSVLREPLMGRDYACPVAPEQEMFMLSPRRTVDGLIRAAGLPGDTLGADRALGLPGITRTVGEMLDALERVAGAKERARVSFSPDPFVRRIVEGWPMRFDLERAAALGFEADGSIEEIVTAFIEDELGGMRHG